MSLPARTGQEKANDTGRQVGVPKGIAVDGYLDVDGQGKAMARSNARFAPCCATPDGDAPPPTVPLWYLSSLPLARFAFHPAPLLPEVFPDALVW